VKMDHLKSLFEQMGFKNVETFIASGNVIFESNKKDRSRLEDEIEKNLLYALGYEVATFIRTPGELSLIVANKPFPAKKYEEAGAINIGLIKEPLSKDLLDLLKALETDIDDFNSLNTEVYWLCKTKQSKSTFSGNLFERKLKLQVTFRGIKTLQKLSDKYNI
jgi:uncharacterized protein (DUF1697 family)